VCQATVYLDENKIAEDVIWLEPTENGVAIRTLFGESRLVEGTLRGIDLLKHRVLLSRKSDQADTCADRARG